MGKRDLDLFRIRSAGANVMKERMPDYGEGILPVLHRKCRYKYSSIVLQRNRVNPIHDLLIP